MAEIKVRATPHVTLRSSGRTKREYWFTAPLSGVLTIDGQNLKMVKNKTYLLHLVNGKFDHYHVIPKKDFDDWELNNPYCDECPEDWCDACIEEYSDDPFEFM